ncbi:MAG: type II toxin-antitoxin system RelE/ParE family toxin [Gammaproteobacteria bacterium]|nr:MAG: type II toxin-antitoxin system RelE/ParE family toxin [Gammaproteobacteria bacterium]
MTLAIQLREEADRDITSAASWYEQQRPGLGHEFLDDVLTATRSIADQPLLYPIVHRNARRALMPRFPFGIYYRVEHSYIVIVAVMHGSRHPRRWQGRT